MCLIVDQHSGNEQLGLMNVIHSVSGSVLLDYKLRSHNQPTVIEGIAVVFRLTINLFSSFWWECWSFSSTVNNTYVLGSHADWKTVSRRVIPSCFVHSCVKVYHCSGKERYSFWLVGQPIRLKKKKISQSTSVVIDGGDEIFVIVHSLKHKLG